MICNGLLFNIPQTLVSFGTVDNADTYPKIIVSYTSGTIKSRYLWISKPAAQWDLVWFILFIICNYIIVTTYNYFT